MEFLFSYIKNICVYVIVITIIFNFFPQKQYSGFVKMFAYYLLVLIMISPIVKVVLKKEVVNIAISNKTYNEKNIESKIDKMEAKIKERFDSDIERKSQGQSNSKH